MKISLYPSSLIRRAYRHGIRRAGQNEDGVSSIEFALIAPFLLLLYFGGVEISLLMLADRQVTSTTATMGDLTSRLLTFSNTDRDNVFAASTALLGTTLGPSAELRVSSLANNGGTITVVWSEASNPVVFGQEQILARQEVLIHRIFLRVFLMFHTNIRNRLRDAVL